MNLRLIATLVGDALKYQSSVNEIDRIGRSLFTFQKERFPNESITSIRAQTVYDWIMTLGRQSMDPEQRTRVLAQFCRSIAPPEVRDEVDRILLDGGAPTALVGREAEQEFLGRGLHREVVRHARKLFSEGNYFHAVFEVAKAYNKQVREKAQSTKDGADLMLDVWGWERGVLKITNCITDTDKNVQDGIKFLSAGLMRAVRNPTAHEPAVDWPIKKDDCLDLLSFLSFLFRKLDFATYWKT
jgi:uncharacterized protein (TIGR02391 family)